MEPMPIKRVTRDLTEAEKSRLERLRSEIARELPDLCERDRMRKEAHGEATLSGELRRAVHASALPLGEIAKRAGVAPIVLDEFLTGERTLRSDVLDRLAGTLGYELSKAP